MVHVMIYDKGRAYMSSRIEIAKEVVSMLLPRVTVASLTGIWQMILPFPLHGNPHLDRAGYFERCWPGRIYSTHRVRR